MNLFLLSLPERILRSASAVAAGLLRETVEVALPSAFQRTRLYRTLVDTTLRFVIEQVGEVEGVYPSAEQIASDFVVRKAAGNGIEFLGILTFHASPVWVLAALADLSGAGRDIVAAIGDSLAEAGLLGKEERFETVDQLLEGFQATAGRTAETINTPPMNVESLRKEWQAIRKEAGRMELPTIEQITACWERVTSEAVAQQRSIFELSSLVALSAINKTGGKFGKSLIDHYAGAIDEISAKGFLPYWSEQFQPYLRAAARQFDPAKQSSTEKLLGAGTARDNR